MLYYRSVLLFTIVVLFTVPLFFNDVLADEERAGMEFSGMNLVVNAELAPPYLTANEADSKNLSIRIFDTITHRNLEKVTYRVEIWQDNELLARNLFYDIDGILNVEIKPKKNCSESELYQCTKYFGSEHVSAPGAIYIENEGRSLITGPVFVKSGLYKINVDIEGATGPTTLVANVPSFETFVSITKEQDFVVQTAQAQQIPITIKTYFDIDDLKFDQSDNSISFDMPFNWDHDYINQIQIVHEDIRIPKSFESYSEEKNFRGFINDVELDNRALLFDPYSNKNTNIIHLLITANELERINDSSGFSNNIDTMKFYIVPYGEITKKSTEFYLVDTNTFESVDTTVNIAWDGQFGAGDKIPFEILFFDENRNLLKDVKYVYSLIDKNENVITTVGNDPSNPGILASEGFDIQNIVIPSSDAYRLDILVLGQGTYYDPTYAGIGSGIIQVGPGAPSSPPPTPKPETPTLPSVEVPSWIQTTAGFWVDGFSSDDEFVNAIEFLINEGVIVIPPTASGGETAAEIPSWIKTTTGYWVNNKITDVEFINAIPSSSFNP